MNETAKQSTSGLAITSLVLGILAIITSYLPILNNGSFLLALLGIVFAAIGLMGINKGKHSGKGIAIAGLVLGIVSIVVVLATQSLFSAAIDSATEEMNPSVVSTSESGTASAAEGESAESAAAESEQSAPEADYHNLPVGKPVTLQNGLELTVNSIEGGLANYDGDEIVRVNVTYTNNGTKSASFNPYDWKAEDPNGALRSQSFYSDAENSLSSGDLSSGGTVTGNIYFDGPVSKVHYYSNMFNDSSTAAWAA